MQGIAFGATAETIASSRRSMRETLRAYQSEVSSLFGAVPQSHIMPERDVVGVSVSVERPDTTIVPEDKTVDKSTRSKSPRQDFMGWRATPLISFSNKKFGVGFAGEVGNFQSHYLDNTSSLYGEEFGSAKFSGIGIYGYFIPEIRMLPNFVTPLVVLGGKTLNVVHESTGTVTSAYATKKSMKYSYAVKKYEAGLDFGILLAKRFTILPWSSYSMVGVESGNERYLLDASTETNTALVSDKMLFWTLSPTLRYGIDFSVQMGNFNIKFGGLLGVLGTLMKTNDRVYENTLTAGVSYDFKSL